MERRDILRDSIGHPSKKLLSFDFDMSFRFQFGASRYIPGLSWTSEKNLSSFEFSRSFCFQFRACRYIIGLNRKSKLKVIAVCLCYDDFLVKYGCGVSRIEWGELRIEISEVVSANTRAWPWAWEVWLLCLPLDHYDTLS